MTQKTKSLIRGGQLFLYNARMLAQVVGRITKWALLIYLAIVAVIISLVMPMTDWRHLIYQVYSWLLNSLGFGDVHVWTEPGNPLAFITAHTFLTGSTQPFVAEAWSHLISSTVLGLSVGLGIYLIAVQLFTWLFVRTGNKYATDQLLTGTRLADSVKDTIQSVKRSPAGASDIKLANKLPLPRFSVWQGILYHGAPGTGKSQGIMRLLDEIKAAGDLAIVYDKECALKPYFYEPELDVELNPLSEDCANWCLWHECSNPIELASLATYLMPKAVQGSDPFWVDAARLIFTSMAWEMRELPQKSAITLLQNLLTTQLDEMAGLLANTEAENLVNKDIAKTAISIRAVLATYTKSLRFLAGLENSDKPPFAIKDWIKQQVEQPQGRKGWLYLTSRASFHEEIKPLLTAWLGMAMKSVQRLSHLKHRNKRIWLIVDEVASLNRIEDLGDIAADLRKFGGCLVLGVQSVSQLRSIYGRDGAEAITDLLSTSIYHRSPRATTAEWVSRDLGDQTLDEVRESQSYGPNPIRDGNTLSSQQVKRRLVEPAVIMQLENLEAYVRLAGNHPVTHLTLNYKERSLQIEQPLIEREINWNALKPLEDAAAFYENHQDVDEALRAELQGKLTEDEESDTVKATTKALAPSKKAKKSTGKNKRSVKAVDEALTNEKHPNELFERSE